eukprot:TRINITY_DN6172_c0_g1_i1.p1 TRINITY_DN6172_c0_g1~~TRINITY_DN6172_c0_g1_i1.p1  ORF type:complete len:295 (+),score=51.14 TRINITY_DN6172_c0_g1_i1:194-1078(+)
MSLNNNMLLETSDVWYRAAGVLAFAFYDASTWSWQQFVGWFVFIVVAMELLARSVLFFGRSAGLDAKDVAIRVRGKPLVKLSPLDIGFIAFNKAMTTLFAYHMMRYAWYSPRVSWRPQELTLSNTLFAIVLFFFVYDFTYTLFHRMLHLRSLYGFIHKHHHRQMAPSRGQTDAINVHPFEFVTGEYNHLFAVYVVANYVLGDVHIVTILVFILLGGVLASLNHTRFDISIPIPFLNKKASTAYLFQVKAHDVHHWYPTCNYGQYTMIWDHIMGSFRPYPKDSDTVVVVDQTKDD